MPHHTFWPGTNVIKSQRNAFSDHLTQPRSTFRGEPEFRAKRGPKRQQSARFGDLEKAAIHL